MLSPSDPLIVIWPAEDGKPRPPLPQFDRRPRARCRHRTRSPSARLRLPDRSAAANVPTSLTPHRGTSYPGTSAWPAPGAAPASPASGRGARSKGGANRNVYRPADNSLPPSCQKRREQVSRRSYNPSLARKADVVVTPCPSRGFIKGVLMRRAIGVLQDARVFTDGAAVFACLAAEPSRWSRSPRPTGSQAKSAASPKVRSQGRPGLPVYPSRPGRGSREQGRELGALRLLRPTRRL